ncbi:hypothetical protein HLK59_48835 [Streptomyces sp. S3(2020)]|uniref:hypothetical protein n=1 Tax=Streptomyces sp. S3(2020) TaxID=2732044 RepID=UPI001489E6FA|nr:hypothetical protein [Streptomyces sp. S3(2020)]NNN38081.1 hypothetical protein [Streptomyces sp. S3(2020)]
MSPAAACWRASATFFSPLMIVPVLSSLWDDHHSWTAMGLDLVGMAVAWGVVSFVWAAVAWGLLKRRARAAGLRLGSGSFEERQTHLLSSPRADEGGQDRVRERLADCERAFLVLGPAADEITFRWRPGRNKDHSVRASLTFDAVAGTVLVDVKGGDGHLGVAGLRKGSAFLAVCQIARALGLEGAKERRGGLV